MTLIVRGYRRATVVLSTAVLLLLCASARVATQAPPPSTAQAAAQQAATGAGAPPFLATGADTRSSSPQTLSFVNRPIVVFRATVVGRSPTERAVGAVRLLDDIVGEGTFGPVESQRFELGTVVTVGGRAAFVLTPSDVDELSGETLGGVVAQSVERLQAALVEAQEARSPRQLLRGLALAVTALAIAVLALWGLARAHRLLVERLVPAAERTLAKSGLGAETVRQSRLIDLEQRVLGSVMATLGLVIVYVTTTFILRRFPYTRPWGESMRGLLLQAAENVGLSIVGAIPGIFTVILVFLLARVIVRVVTVWFRAVEEGRTTARWIYPETALPTRRLASAFVWLLALVVAYPYMPGSGTDAFKGLSVFVGLLLSFGSSGLVNQVMSGFMITYSRSVRLNEFVRIGDSVGTVTHLGVLSTRVRTLQNEEVTIPNAVVVAQTTTNYSRASDHKPVFTPTSLTIGYDTPWRQVHALLTEAAAKTAGVLREPAPIVYQTSLDDFYVKYTLFVCLERQDARLVVLNALYANIQDQFNAYGVQIMSPNYVLDPKAAKVVPRDQWYAAPARPEAGATLEV